MPETEALQRLVYCSRNAVAGVPADMAREVARILAAARRNNARQGVTGALLLSEGYFAQVLEGPPAAVEQVFEAIACDPRHDDVVVLSAGPAMERLFGAWSMAYAGALGAEMARHPGPPWAVADRCTAAAAAVLAQLRAVVRRDAPWLPRAAGSPGPETTRPAAAPARAPTRFPSEPQETSRMPKMLRHAPVLALLAGLCPGLAPAQEFRPPAKPFSQWTPAEHGDLAVALDRPCRARCDGHMHWTGAFGDREEHELAACLAGCMATQLPEDHPNRAPLRAAAWERYEQARSLGSGLPAPVVPR